MHVEEPNIQASRAERLLDQRAPLRAHGHEHRFAGIEALFDEGRGTVDELVVPGVQQRFVAKEVLRSPGLTVG
jgi:hypothetical protein